MSLLNEKQKELAVLVARDLVVKLLEEPGKHLVQGKEGVTKAFAEVLSGVTAAMSDLFIPPKKS